MINAINTNPVQTVNAGANVLFDGTNVRTNSCKPCQGWLNFSTLNSGIFEITKTLYDSDLKILISIQKNKKTSADILKNTFCCAIITPCTRCALRGGL